MSDEVVAEYWASLENLRAAKERHAKALAGVGGKPPIPGRARTVEDEWDRLAAIPAPPPSTAAQLRPARHVHVFDLPAWEGIELPTRAWHVLANLGVRTPRDLLGLSPFALLETANMGEKTAGFIARVRAKQKA